MKKCYLFLVSFICLSLCFTSCSKDDDDDKDPDKLPETSLTPEEIKDLIQKEGNAFLSEIEGLSNNKGLQVLLYFSELWGLDDEDYYYPEYPNYENNGKMISAAVNKITKAAGMSDYYITFTWNSDTEEWDEKKNDSEQAEFFFPSNDRSSSNDAKIVVTGTASNVSISDGGKEYVLPKQAVATIFVGNEKVATINADVAWVSEDKAPNSAKVDIDLIDYTIVANVTKGNPNHSTAILKKGNKVLIDAKADFNTDLDKSLANESIDKGKVNNVVAKVLDQLSFAGEMDVKAYLDEQDRLDDVYYEEGYGSIGWEQAEKNFAKGIAEAFNKHSNILLVSKDEKLATLRARAKDHTYYSEMVLVLKFDDETEVDVDVYFGSGFDTFLKNWEKFLNSFR